MPEHDEALADLTRGLRACLEQCRADGATDDEIDAFITGFCAALAALPPINLD